MNYIEREKVQNCLDNLSNEHLIGSENDTFISLAEAKDRIEEIPTADVVEVRHGYNKSFDYPSLFECSVCGSSDGDTYTGEGEYKYCPWCGAKMDGERRET